MGKMKVTKEDRQWAMEVKSMSNNKCIICGKERMLNAHHIIPKENPNFRHDLKNGIALCPSHHRFIRKGISAHQGSFAFFIWLRDNQPEQFKYLEEKIKNENLV